MDFSIEKIIDALEKDVKSRKRLAELIVIEPDIRLAIINAIIRDVATKSDIEKLRIEMKESIEEFRRTAKEDVEKLRAVTKDDIEKLRTELKEDIEKLGISTKENIEKLRIETREDIEKLRSEFRNELNQFRSELNQLRSEVHSNFRWIVGLIFGMWTSMMVCLIPILLKLIGMI